MVTINVNGKDYEIDERQEGLMVFVQKAKAIEQGGIKINNIDNPTFDFVIRILAEMEYDIKEPPKVSTSVLEDVIGPQLAALIGNLNAKEIDNLYRAVHFLEIRNLRLSIAAVMACRVYIRPTLADYNKKKAELGLTQELTTEISRMYKERFPFMN
jgi:hypothetical protein